MFFFFVCGEHTFRNEVKGYEGIICQCHHCGNMAGRVVKSRPFFTFCFVPVIPLFFRGYEDVQCSICNFQQPLEHRPDVQAMRRDVNSPSAHQPGQHQPPQQPALQGPPGQWKGPAGDRQRYA